MRIKIESPAVAAYADKHSVDLTAVKGTGADGRVTLEDVKAAVPAPYVTPVVAKLAAQHGVDLRDVEGTGIGGRIRRDDVLQAAGALPAAGTALPSGGAVHPISATGRTGFARNPLVDRVRAEARAAGRPAPGGAAPSLFPNGQDLPSFTASGIAPQVLLEAPPQARHAMAAAPTAAQAYAILEQCSGPDAEQTAAALYGQHDGNAEYADRVEQWRLRSMSDQELFDSIESGTREELNRREAQRPLNLAHTAPPAAPAVARVEAKVPDDVADVPAGAMLFSNGRVPGQWSDPSRYR